MSKDNKEKELNKDILNEEKKLLEELEILKKLLEEKDESHKRALADYINLKRRTDEDKIAVIKFANEVLIEKFIGIFNDLEEANKHINDNGLAKVIDKFLKILKDEGVEIIDPLGKEFNSDDMEAIESIKGKKNYVEKVYRKGFKLNGKTIITAMIAVGNGETE